MRPETVEGITAEWSSAVRKYLDTPEGKRLEMVYTPIAHRVLVSLLEAYAVAPSDSYGSVLDDLMRQRRRRISAAKSELETLLFLEDSDLDEDGTAKLFDSLLVMARSLMLAIGQIAERQHGYVENSAIPTVVVPPPAPEQHLSDGSPTMIAPYDERALKCLSDPNMSLDMLTRERLLMPSVPPELEQAVHSSFLPAIPPPPCLPTGFDDEPLISVDYLPPMDWDQVDDDEPSGRKKR